MDKAEAYFIGKTANILCRLADLVENGTITEQLNTYRKGMVAGLYPSDIEEVLPYLGNNPDGDFGLDEARRPTNAEDPVNLSVEFKNWFLYLSKNNIDYDCEFQVYSHFAVTFFEVKDPVTFKAHKFLFAAASEVFRKMFQKTGNSGTPTRGNGSRNCSRNIKPDDIFIIRDMEADGFKNMRHFIYTGEVTFSSTLNALSTFLAARKYIIPALCKECINYMVKNIKREELFNLFPSANALKVQSEFEELFKKKEIRFAQDFE